MGIRLCSHRLVAITSQLRSSIHLKAQGWVEFVMDTFGGSLRKPWPTSREATANALVFARVFLARSNVAGSHGRRPGFRALAPDVFADRWRGKPYLEWRHRRRSENRKRSCK